MEIEVERIVERIVEIPVERVVKVETVVEVVRHIKDEVRPLFRSIIFLILITISPFIFWARIDQSIYFLGTNKCGWAGRGGGGAVCGPARRRFRRNCFRFRSVPVFACY